MLTVVALFAIAGPTLGADENKAMPASTGVARAQSEFSSQVRPLVERLCLDCHGGAKPEASLDLARFADAPSLASNRDAWQKVSRRVRAEDMPPDDAPQPTAAERRQFVDAVRVVLAGGQTPTINPGRVTLRRLNRAEYDNTIHDLAGIDFHPAQDFPSDDVGYGFDNIGDVLSTPPLLLEKYLAAARRISEAAIVVPGPPRVQASLTDKRLKSKVAREEYGGRYLATNGEVYCKATVDAAGEFLVRVTAFGDQAGSEPAKMELSVDGEKQTVFDVTAEANAPRDYTHRLPLKVGDHRITLAFINDYYEPENPDAHRRDRNLAVMQVDVCGPLSDDFSKLPESHRRIIPRKPGAETQRADAEEFIKKFASRAYRRPARPDEVERLLKLFELAISDGQSFEQGMRLVMQAVLVSPHFLYRVELDPPGVAPGAAYEVSPFELASRLSYFLWSTMPDHELLTLARQNKLTEPDVLEAQVGRMLRDAKSEALVTNFAGQWLQLRLVRSLAPDTKDFPAFDEPLRAAMIRETELFFSAILRENHSVMEFLDADYTFVNDRLARHYGLPGGMGAEFRRVALPPEQRGGLLGEASVLALTSNPTRTSPVKRGRWVLENLLGTPPPAPPPDAPPLAEKDAGPLQGTLRERMSAHRDKAECAVCHKTMDPLGFGLENFDAIGAWRERDGGAPVDASGELPGGQTFRGPRELKGVLKSRRTLFLRCMAEKLLTYAIGRGLEYDDQQAVDAIVAASETDDRLQSMILAVVKSDPFRRRSAAATP